jgi:phosphoserine aminotransferase
MKIIKKTENNKFSCGPCKKRPGWDNNIFDIKYLGRSHRSEELKKYIKEVIEFQKEILKLPKDYYLAIIPGSDTGAIEAAMWNLLGERGVDIIVFDTFSIHWRDDIVKQLQIKDYREFKADFGKFPDISNVDSDRDIVFVYNGTTSGVCFDNLDFIKEDRKGLTFCDATSVAFAIDIDWNKIDVLTYSWQKVLGGEAAHGMLVLSPKAMERLKNFTPENRAIPQIFLLKEKEKINLDIYEGLTINTPSLLCVEDFKDALNWAKNIGGLNALIKRCKENSDYLYNFANTNKYFKPLVEIEKYRSPTSVCITLKDEFFGNKTEDERKVFIKDIVKILDKEEVAFDINGYRSAPACFRIWCGPTLEIEDIKNLCEWLNKLIYEKLK